MQLSNRLVQFWLIAVAIMITGCTSSLPELPRELEIDTDVSEPVQSEPAPTAPSAAPVTTEPPPPPPPPPPPTTPIVPTPLPTPVPTTVSQPSPSEVTLATAPVPQAQTITLKESPEVPESGIRVLHKASYNPFDRDNGKNFRALNTLELYRSELGRHSIESTKPVDFSSAQVLVSSIGEKPTGGYTVSATDIEEFEDNIVVTVVQTIPGPSCITTQGVTHPFEFVVVPSRKPIEVFERQRVSECQ